MRSEHGSRPGLPAHIAWSGRVTGGALALALAFVLPQNADAAVAPIHTLPFFDSYSIGYGFGEYTGHEGTDYFIGAYSSGGERVAAASGGTAIDCYQSGIGAGNIVVMDHGNGQRTRYLHLNEDIINDGDIVARGKVLGYEGNVGVADQSYHLHFETRHGATAFNCNKDSTSGTAVDPYATGTYMWTLDPPVYASSCYLPQDSASGPGRWPGVFRPSQDAIVWWGVRYSNTEGSAQTSYNYGATCDMPITGDWDGDGDDTIGIVRPVGAWLEWHLSNNNSTAVVYSYGNATDLPVAGDWNGDGTDSIGVFRPSNATWYLSNNNSYEYTHFPYGNPTDRPVVGDWDGDGDVTVGVFRPSEATWYLSNNNSYEYTHFPYGNPTDTPLTGDWDWDGDDTIGVFRPSEAKWYLRNYNWTGTPSVTPFMYGAISDKPITGDWN